MYCKGLAVQLTYILQAISPLFPNNPRERQMATTYTADQAASTYPVYTGMAGEMCVAWGTYEIATALVQNDVIKFCKVPANAVILGGWLLADDIDSGTGVFDFDIGYSSDTDAFGNLGALNGSAVTNVNPEGGIKIPLGGVLLTDGPKLLTSETTIQGICNVAANAGGTGTMSVVVYYTMRVTTT